MGDGAAWQTPSLPCPRHQPRAGNPRAPSVTDLGSAKGRSGPGRGTAGDVTNGTRRAESPESPPAAAAGSGGANERARGPAQHASERSPLPEAAAAFSFAVVDARSGCGTVGPVLGAAPAPGLGSQYLPQLFGCYRRSASKMAARGGGGRGTASASGAPFARGSASLGSSVKGSTVRSRVSRVSQLGLGVSTSRRWAKCCWRVRSGK